MIRSAKVQKFWSSVNLEKGLGEILGFLCLNDLLIIAETTKYETYSIWEAVSDKYVSYSQAKIMLPSTTLSEAIKMLETRAFKVAIVREHPYELGLVSLSHIIDCNKRYLKTLRQSKNLVKKQKKQVQEAESKQSVALKTALRDKIVKATIKDINKAAYFKSMDDQTEQLKKLEAFSADLKSKFNSIRLTKAKEPQPELKRRVSNAIGQSIIKRIDSEHKHKDVHVRFDDVETSAEPIVEDKVKVE